MDACKAQGMEEPTWRSDGGFVTITFKRPIVAKSDTEQRETPTKYRPSTDQVPTKYRPSTDQVQKMILSMGDGYMTMSEIMSNIGLKHRPSFRENYFLPAFTYYYTEVLYRFVFVSLLDCYQVFRLLYIGKASCE